MSSSVAPPLFTRLAEWASSSAVHVASSTYSWCAEFLASTRIDPESMLQEAGLSASDSLSPFASAWLWLLRVVPNEFLVMTVVSLALLIVVYVLASLPYILIDAFQPSFLFKYKIQKGEERVVTTAETWKCVRRLVFNHLILALPLTMLSYPALKWRGVTIDFNFPTFWDTVLRVLLYFVIEDFWFYWGHRFLHTPWAYNNIHYIHHEFDHPIGMASSYAHPVEFIFLGVGTFLGPILVGGGHLTSIWVWMYFRQQEAIECHCGYDLPFHLNKIFPFYCGAFHHDYHHCFYKQNYASVFTWCDRLFGTDKDYSKWVSRGGHEGTARRMQGASSPNTPKDGFPGEDESKKEK